MLQKTPYNGLLKARIGSAHFLRMCRNHIKINMLRSIDRISILRILYSSLLPFYTFY